MDSSGPTAPRPRRVEPAAAYDLWAETYDENPPNLILRLEDSIFSRLLERIDLADRNVVDFGCGTGRHWGQILKCKPHALTGYDVSAEMLNRLRRKIPEARAHLLHDCALRETPSSSTDVVVSTLALSYVADLDGALREWNRILCSNGNVLLTDLHPVALEKGADRTFRHDGRLLAIENHVHSIDRIRLVTRRLGWAEVELLELQIDSTLRHYYEDQGALPVYERFRDTPIVYGMRLTKA